MSRADDAKRILDDPLFDESFTELKAQLVKEWLHTAPDQVDKREQLHLSIHIADRLLAHLTSILEEGQMAEIYSTHNLT
jgi:hypothetical protein